MALIYDPPAQGERLEYPDRDGLPHIGFGVHSHHVAGNQMTLIGWNFALEPCEDTDYQATTPVQSLYFLQFATTLGNSGNRAAGGGVIRSRCCPEPSFTRRRIP